MSASNSKILGWAASVVAAVLVTVSVNALNEDPDVEVAEAKSFLVQHYENAFSNDPQVEKVAWEHDLTSNYRTYWNDDFARFHRRYHVKLSRVSVVKVLPDVNAANQFPVTLDVTERQSGSTTRRNFIMTLQCTDQTARLPLRSCPSDHIQIHVVENVPLTSG